MSGTMEFTEDVPYRDVVQNLPREKTIVQEASNFITELLVRQQQFYALEWLCHFDVLTRIPLPPYAAPYAEVAVKANVPQQRLKSIARMAMTANFLCETGDGRLSHNALSASFVQNSGLRTQLLHLITHTSPVMASLTAATEKWGETTAPNETAYNITHKTDMAFFDHLKSRPDLSDEFDEYMRSKITSHSGTSVEYLLQGFDWASRDKATVVDVGGGAGEAVITLATAHPEMNFVIQDLARPISNARCKVEDLPKAISGRIGLQEYDFFTPQPIQGADVYLLRTIIHDWPDADAIQILKKIGDAMNPSSRLLIMDMVLPMPGSTDKMFEAALRQKDLAMIQAFNAKEREAEDWYALVAAAGLKLLAIERPGGSQLSVLEVSRIQDDGKYANGLNGY